jgi:hypothetical protein
MAETTATKKTSSKKSAGKAPAKKASAKRSSAKKATADTSAPGSGSTTAKKTPRRRKAPAKASAEAPPRQSGARLAGSAREAVEELTGRTPESVTALERSEDGWRVAVEVLELERIPSTTDVMATYEVSLDERGELQGYRRVHRYLRGSAGDE